MNKVAYYKECIYKQASDNSKYKIPHGWDRIRNPHAEREDHNNFADEMRATGDNCISLSKHQLPVASDGAGNYYIIDTSSGKPQGKFWYHDDEPGRLHDLSTRDKRMLGFDNSKYQPTPQEQRLLDRGIKSERQIDNMSSEELRKLNELVTGKKRSAFAGLGTALASAPLGLAFGGALGQKIGKGKGAAIGGSLGAISSAIAGKHLADTAHIDDVRRSMKHHLDHYRYEAGLD